MAKYKLHFQKEEIKCAIEKIKTKENKRMYLTFLNEKLKDIFINYNVNNTIALLKEYKLLDKFKNDDKLRDKNLIVSKFKEWLNEEIRPFVGKLLLILEYDLDNSRFKNEQADLNKKYPTYDFNETTIIFRCNKDYPEYDERISYLEYVIEKFKIFIGDNDSDWFYEAIGRPSLRVFIPKIQREIEKLKKESILFEKINKKSENKSSKKINKFKWQGTEKGLLLLMDLLYDSDFLEKGDYNICNSILRDTFLNKKGIPFDNRQLTVTRTKVNERIIINENDLDISKFRKLQNQLNKAILNSKS